ncbi:alpha/beta fold hydrolase [Accumulibacter sp.]|uniref:alpha/beta fold hydrolase n=1 Tax=Accumulibacter sp. TaxID=2053492 RepID=UPI0025E4AC43|nr:alpha/beta fold hydrolase [Accumulibacter sp.]MCM8594092.1 alpha/beta fold hydrolase [Accumulibacter sp.]MCM8624501.1 alpha/beta fold hydrolase [Accumulibacter sp.]MDS4048236.1 alpha/beta fold hydrolase [Accumulibacter sp.]
MSKDDASIAGGPPADTVILVHGLWTPALVCTPHGRWLRRRGHQVRYFAYPSVRATLSENAQALRGFVATTGAARIDFVGHSLGGLIILEMLAGPADPRFRRAVLLGTPCLDSHCARRLAGVPGMTTILGRSIIEWLSRAQATGIRAPSGIEVGVVAGTRSVGLGRVVPGLPRPNDGVVALAETRLPGAKDSVALPVAHSAMLVSRRCAAEIASFLETGRFTDERPG